MIEYLIGVLTGVFITISLGSLSWGTFVVVRVRRIARASLERAALGRPREHGRRAERNANDKAAAYWSEAFQKATPPIDVTTPAGRRQAEELLAREKDWRYDRRMRGEL